MKPGQRAEGQGTHWGCVEKELCWSKPQTSADHIAYRSFDIMAIKHSWNFRKYAAFWKVG